MFGRFCCGYQAFVAEVEKMLLRLEVQQTAEGTMLLGTFSMCARYVYVPGQLGTTTL